MAIQPTVVGSDTDHTGERVFAMAGAAFGMTWIPAATPNLFQLKTSVPGIFAAGDVRHGSVKRVASSVGEGSMAGTFVHQYPALTSSR